MAVGTQVSVEEYLHTSYRPDRDYVDGELQERNVGEKDHGKTQGRIYRYLCNLHPELDERLIPEQRVQVKTTRFRVPDLCLIAEDAPDEQVLRYPPLLCVEILSPEDRLSRYLDRLKDYFEMGVRACWIVDPVTRQGWVATAGQLTEVSDGVLRFAEFELPLKKVLK